MKAVVQRVAKPASTLPAAPSAPSAPGLLVLLCAERGDTDALADKHARQAAEAAHLRDEAGKMNRSVQDIGGGLLVVSQFTLAADVSGGNRPSFTQAAPPDEGRRLYDYFVAQARAAHPVVADRRVRRRHAGAPGQRRAGDDSAADDGVAAGRASVGIADAQLREDQDLVAPPSPAASASPVSWSQPCACSVPCTSRCA
jgi:D-tyrosyl-tRNA(Tyr) deacylase